jgi:hypothetical protein
MTRPLSQHLRDRVIAAVDGGLSCNAAAEPPSQLLLPKSIVTLTRKRQPSTAGPMAIPNRSLAS